jgi:outer membrane protein assembly factor BamB
MSDRPRPGFDPAPTLRLLVPALCAAAVFVSAVGGCRSGEARYAGSDAGAGFGDGAALPVAKQAEPLRAFEDLGYQPQWIGYSVVPTGRRVKFVDAYADTIAVHESGNSITILESATGRPRWSLDLGSDLEKFVGNVRDASGNFLCCSQGEIFFVDQTTGLITDRQKLGSIVNTKPALFESMAIFGCPTGEVLGHNLISGYKQWGYTLDGAIDQPPIDVAGRAGIVSARGEVAILEPRRGGSVARGKTFGGPGAALATGDERLYIASLDQSLWAFKAYDGQAQWRYRTEYPLRTRPVFHEGKLYASVPGKGLICFEAGTGTALWTLSGFGGEVVGVRGGNLVAWDGAQALTIDPVRGDAIARVELPGVSHLVTDAFVDGNLIAVTPRGEVRKYSPRR